MAIDKGCFLFLASDISRVCVYPHSLICIFYSIFEIDCCTLCHFMYLYCYTLITLFKMFLEKSIDNFLDRLFSVFIVFRITKEKLCGWTPKWILHKCICNETNFSWQLEEPFTVLEIILTAHLEKQAETIARFLLLAKCNLAKKKKLLEPTWICEKVCRFTCGRSVVSPQIHCIMLLGSLFPQ
jgi:hypothetical protein